MVVVCVKLKKIKKVVAYGDSYYLTFRFPYRQVGLFCQKDLLTDGTIEEFESLFAGKIVKYNGKD